MFGLSSTAILSAVSAIVGFVMKFMTLRAQISADQKKAELERMTTSHEQRMDFERLRIEASQQMTKNEVRLAKADPSRSMTRRVIAYIILAGLISIPTLSEIHAIEWFRFTTDTIKSSGFLGLFGGKETIVHGVQTASGVPLVWITVVSELAVMIVSFYVGQSACHMHKK